MRRYSKQRSYCRFCHKHTSMTISAVKKQSPSELTRGQRKFRAITAGYGGFPRPKPTPKVQNPIKKINILRRCNVCNRGYHYPAIKAKVFNLTKI